MPDVLSLFAQLPIKERWFVRARLNSAPLPEMAARVPAGKVLDVGCGHGLLTALLAHHRDDRNVLGIDPDEAKLVWAKAALKGLPNVSLQTERIENLSPRLDGSFDAIVVADVLYLLPKTQWEPFLKVCCALLKPTGKLLMKEAAADGSWKYWKCLAQEKAMVFLFRKTKSSGAVGFAPLEVTEAVLRAAGFEIESTEDFSSGYSTPHVLFVAHPA